MESFSQNYVMGKGISSWEGGRSYSVTFIVTEDCNLRCKYCYQVNKNNKMRMSIDIAKKAVDYLLDNPQLFSSESVIWEFIGGEPLLEIDLINQICDYIKIQMYVKNHPWFNRFRFSIGTNGTLYNTPQVQKFVRRNRANSSVSVTIDGTKIKHDLQRVYADGKGSYDNVIKNVPLWLADYPGATTKVTFGHNDLSYLKDSIIHLWNQGLKDIPANVVFEDVWQDGDQLIYEEQLKQLADYIIENELWDKVNCSFFDDTLGSPLRESDLNTNFCGTGRMLAIDGEGNFYPCLRFADFSLGKKEPRIIGNVHTGIIEDKVRPFLTLSTKSFSLEECIECEVAKGCAWCQGNNYDESVDSTIFNRVTFICEMHKARVRANNYYWAKLENNFGIKRRIDILVKKYMYFIVADDAVEYCDYQSRDKNLSVMDKTTFEKGIEFCYKNFYRPVILHSKNSSHDIDTELYDSIIKNEIFSCENISPKHIERKYVVYGMDNTNIMKDMSNCILNVYPNEINRLSDTIMFILKKCDRININFKDINTDFPLEIYSEELNKIVEDLYGYYKSGKVKEVNVITDRAFMSKMDNCMSGENVISLAPNGRFYICPAFYFDNSDDAIGSLEEGIDWKKIEQCKLKNATMCHLCDAFQCNRCVYLNKKVTEEYSVSPSIQCKKSHVERTATCNFIHMCSELDLTLEKLEPIQYDDPLKIIIDKLDVNPYGMKFC